MESMTTRLDAHSFTARHGSRNTLRPAPVLDYSRLAYGQATAANYFPNGAQKYQMWGFVAEAPQAGIGVSLAEIAEKLAGRCRLSPWADVEPGALIGGALAHVGVAVGAQHVDGARHRLAGRPLAGHQHHARLH